MPIMSYAFYCVFESVMQLPNFDWEEDRQHAGQWGCARYAVQDFAESYDLNEGDENRIRREIISLIYCYFIGRE